MKYLITSFLLLFTVSAQAQITLEHTYNIGTEPSAFQIGLIEIDSGLWKYVSYRNTQTLDTAQYLMIYNLDHSLERMIRLYQALPQGARTEIPLGIAKNLFDLSGKYVYFYSVQYYDNLISQNALRIIREDSTILFACDSCELYDRSPTNPSFLDLYGVFSTDSGVKMMVDNEVSSGNHEVNIYSLPGKLPTCSTTALSAVNPSIAYTNPTLPTSAYPNPSSGQVRIAYELPSGVSSGDLILTTEDGREVKRYHVTSAFSDLLIDSGELPSGSYFYHLVTEKGESQAQRIVLSK